MIIRLKILSSKGEATRAWPTVELLRSVKYFSWECFYAASKWLTDLKILLYCGSILFLSNSVFFLFLFYLFRYEIVEFSSVDMKKISSVQLFCRLPLLSEDVADSQIIAKDPQKAVCFFKPAHPHIEPAMPVCQIMKLKWPSPHSHTSGVMDGLVI